MLKFKGPKNRSERKNLGKAVYFLVTPVTASLPLETWRSVRISVNQVTNVYRMPLCP